MSIVQQAARAVSRAYLSTGPDSNRGSNRGKGTRDTDGPTPPCADRWTDTANLTVCLCVCARVEGACKCEILVLGKTAGSVCQHCPWIDECCTVRVLESTVERERITDSSMAD